MREDYGPVPKEEALKDDDDSEDDATVDDSRLDAEAEAFLAKWHEAIPHMINEQQWTEGSSRGEGDEREKKTEKKRVRLLLAVPISGDDVSVVSSRHRVRSSSSAPAALRDPNLTYYAIFNNRS